jgi:uncharacterized protein (TIGR00252 family)
MRSWRRWRGQHGEQMAVQFLQRQGYRIQHQNYRCRGGEVDIVAWDGPTLVFIEVKTKGQTLFGAPQAMVDARKQKKLCMLPWSMSSNTSYRTSTSVLMSWPSHSSPVCLLK